MTPEVLSSPQQEERKKHAGNRKTYLASLAKQ